MGTRNNGIHRLFLSSPFGFAQGRLWPQKARLGSGTRATYVIDPELKSNPGRTKASVPTRASKRVEILRLRLVFALSAQRPILAQDDNNKRPRSSTCFARLRSGQALRLRSGQALSRSVRKGGRHGPRSSTRRTGRIGPRFPPLPRTQGWGTLSCGDSRRIIKVGHPPRPRFSFRRWRVKVPTLKSQTPRF